jgi:hypothetical protein
LILSNSLYAEVIRAEVESLSITNDSDAAQ